MAEAVKNLGCHLVMALAAPDLRVPSARSRREAAVGAAVLGEDHHQAVRIGGKRHHVCWGVGAVLGPAIEQAAPPDLVAADLGPGSPLAARTIGPAGGDGSAAVSSEIRTVRSWPLLILAAPAAAGVWSGWVGIAEKTGFGLVSPLPGILPSLHASLTIRPESLSPGASYKIVSLPGPA